MNSSKGGRVVTRCDHHSPVEVSTLSCHRGTIVVSTTGWANREFIGILDWSLCDQGGGRPQQCDPLCTGL